MKPTLEQINMLSDYELNCAIAEKKGYRIIRRDPCTVTMSQQTVGAITARRFDPCNNPNDYMPIAIEHDITIYIDNGRVKCFDPIGELDTGWLPKAQTGRAVGIAFLLMQIK